MPLDAVGPCEGQVAGRVRALMAQAMSTGNPGVLLSLVPQFQARMHKKGGVLLHQGAVWDQAFFVERGLLRMHTIEGDGKDFSKSFWPGGTMFFPLTPGMESEALPFNVSALEDSVVWSAPLVDLRTGLHAKGLWEPFRAELLGRLLHRKSQRELDLLTLDGKARYQKFCQQEPDLAGRVPLVHLASFLGLTDVSLSRIRRQINKAAQN